MGIKMKSEEVIKEKLEELIRMGETTPSFLLDPGIQRDIMNLNWVLKDE